MGSFWTGIRPDEGIGIKSGPETPLYSSASFRTSSEHFLRSLHKYQIMYPPKLKFNKLPTLLFHFSHHESTKIQAIKITC